MEYPATEMAKKLGISRSYLYYLKDSCAVSVRVSEQGRFIWDDEVYEALREYIQKNKPREQKVKPVESCKTFMINNRRYLGNKYKLLPFITQVVERECSNVNTVADIFAGTGSVASAFTDRKLITNDNLYSNYICHLAWFSPQSYDEEKLIAMVREYNGTDVEEDNYMSLNFADTYFSREDCRKIGFIREDVEMQYKDGLINERERALLITSLLYAMDKIANTCGHYDAYRRGVEFDRHIELAVPFPQRELNRNNVCYNTDTNQLVREIYADLVYIDPPYNSRQYCDAYHLLENVARWEKPEVFGVAKKMERGALKSEYCTRRAADAFADLIESISAKYILLSYNNMAEKGNDRSNAKISDRDITRILEKKGRVKVFSEEYKAFTTGKSDIKGNEERLFLCICDDPEKKKVSSALNYTGGKYRLLPQILPHFPKEIDRAVDLFCGGCNVGINLDCSRVLFNDTEEHLIGLLELLRRLSGEEMLGRIYRLIDRYGLSLVSKNGYAYYGCDSSAGLTDYNRSAYCRLRDDFNALQVRDDEYYVMLYVLLVYSFNNQLRFNGKGEFNLPVGKRDFNARMEEKLLRFMSRLKDGDYEFTCRSFLDVPMDGLTGDSFVYADSPYLITNASYNEKNGWTEADERSLLGYLDGLDKRGVRFALSNVMENKGKHNEILKAWVEERPHYRVIDLDFSYRNSNYHAGNRDKRTREVLIVNYPEEEMIR